jgi:hypothetical protein
MKKILFIVAVVITASTMANAQGFRKIPATVTEAFKAQFPEATNVSWKDKTTGFEAGYQLQGKKMFTKFTGKGQWIRTETIMSYSELNQDILTGLQKSKFNNWAIKDVRKFESKTHGTLYRIEVKKGLFSNKYLYFNVKGELQKDNMTL